MVSGFGRAPDELDLVICRRLLIVLQAGAMPGFHSEPKVLLEGRRIFLSGESELADESADVSAFYLPEYKMGGCDTGICSTSAQNCACRSYDYRAAPRNCLSQW